MDPVVAAALLSWKIEIGPTVAILAFALVYLRGFRRVRAQMPDRFPWWRLAAFESGLTLLFVAIASPLDSFANLLLAVHMAQHLILTMVVPPLVWFGAPAVPLLRGLPVAVSRDALGPFLAWPALRRLGERLTHPVTCFGVFVATTWIWHVPALYELALRSPGWHRVEHACFLSAALLLWWPVIQPWPSREHWPRWAVIPFLVLVDLQNTALSALFAFSERVLYSAYDSAPRLLGLSPIDDQQLAGALMWVGGSVAFLGPVVVLVVRLLGGDLARPSAPASRESRAIVGDRGAVPVRDVLALPALGALLRSLAFRRTMQGFTLVLAVAVIADGLVGPQMSPMNLAGVWPWTWYRGLAVIALLAVGNVFCFACPFMLPRELAKRLLPARRRWPRALRSKWLAAGLLIAYLWSYETFDLWDLPAATAWVLIAYFATAFVVDGLFRGASFCKYVCPIGQFHFVHSTLSPLEVRVRRPEACATCTTHDCIRGTGERRGCETALFVPRKTGNLDCTFCLDCVRACPHDNVGLVAVAPGRELLGDPHRSSLGRLSRRADLAALVLALVFGAFVNAAGMVGPIVTAGADLAARFGPRVGAAISSASLLAALLLLPALLAALCGVSSTALGRALGARGPGFRDGLCRFSLALIPIGFAMWAAHLIFHLVTGAATALPVAQRAALDLGFDAFGAPDWAAAMPGTDPGWILPIKLLLLDAGLCASLYLAWRVACDIAPLPRAALGVALPWAGLATALWAVGIWLLLQPMQMRGTMIH